MEFVNELLWRGRLFTPTQTINDTAKLGFLNGHVAAVAGSCIINDRVNEKVTMISTTIARSIEIGTVNYVPEGLCQKCAVHFI